jgi:hypothetical protein
MVVTEGRCGNDNKSTFIHCSHKAKLRLYQPRWLVRHCFGFPSLGQEALPGVTAPLGQECLCGDGGLNLFAVCFFS